MVRIQIIVFSRHGGEPGFAIMLNDCYKKLREASTLRTQFVALPLGNKTKYLSVLMHAYGGNISEEEYAASFYKTIYKTYAPAYIPAKSAED